MLREVYSNTKSSGFTINFFNNVSVNPKQALLAAPFFTDIKAIESLTGKGCKVSVVVRLCEATEPKALRAALKNPLVSIRYYTDRKFHAKFYIVDDIALVGSANLTYSGMMTNREVSVLLKRGRDESFDSLPGIFDDLWNYADVLTEPVIKEFEKIKKSYSTAAANLAFESALDKVVRPANPRSVVVGSEIVAKERLFLQSFKRKYDEVLMPFHQEIMSVAQSAGFGRPEYNGQDPEIEMGRFLGWIRLVHAPKDSWKDTPLLDELGRRNQINQFVQEWQSTSDTVARDMYDAEKEIENIANIKSIFRSAESIEDADYDTIFDTLLGCHAFLEQLRFTKGGLRNLRVEFGKRNSLSSIKKTLSHLLHGPGDSIERAYDCLHDERLRLEKFGEASTMELLGWHSDDRPPFNNRTIRGMRFLGFDVENLVVGA